MDKVGFHVGLSAAIGAAEIVFSIYSNSYFNNPILIFVLNAVLMTLYAKWKANYLLEQISKIYPDLLQQHPKLDRQYLFRFIFMLEGEEIDKKLKHDMIEPHIIRALYIITFFSIGLIAVTNK